jgi:hypothetical protein
MKDIVWWKNVSQLIIEAVLNKFASFTAFELQSSTLPRSLKQK